MLLKTENMTAETKYSTEGLEDTQFNSPEGREKKQVCFHAGGRGSEKINRGLASQSNARLNGNPEKESREDWKANHQYKIQESLPEKK